MSTQRPPAPEFGHLTRAWLRQAHTAVTAHSNVLDALNVYPVPDSDTGRNVCLTLAAAAEAPADQPLPEVARAMLFAAHGNSGSIMAQFMRGWLRSATETTVLCGAVLAEALQQGAEAAQHAVRHPAAGTILTVCQRTAEAARIANTTDLTKCYRHALTRTHEALVDTETELPELTAAGCVDAGGAAWLVMFDALGETLGVDRPALPTWTVPQSSPVAQLVEEHEVLATFDADQQTAEQARELAHEWGNSVVLIGSDHTWKLHLHTHAPAEFERLLVSLVPTPQLTISAMESDT